MSRLGRTAVIIPKGVEVKISGKMIQVKGPKGTLEFPLNPQFEVKIGDGEVSVIKIDQEADDCFHGLLRAQINVMIIGVTQGYEKKLSLIGVGYRANLQGNTLDLALGYSHPIKLAIPQNLKVVVDKNVAIVVSGIDKQLVGQFAATIRSKRPPEPYKGKGIRYENEYVRKKDGKAAKGKAA